MHPFFLPFTPERSSFSITHSDALFLIGSCFTTHMAKGLQAAGFSLLANPCGNLFDPLSITQNLRHCLLGTRFTEKDLFHYDELYFSWHHHSSLASPDPEVALEKINQAHREAQQFLSHTRYLFITLGTAFHYVLKNTGMPVANCHKYPATHFERKLLTQQTIVSELIDVIMMLKKINPNVQVILTISPVRHAREGIGIIDNNLSKARLIASTHQLLNEYGDVFSYFPAYEILIDVLRDYRFYDADLVHPNYLATEFIFNFLLQTFTDSPTQAIIKEITAITRATQHKTIHPNTQKHRHFLQTQLEKIRSIEQKYPHISLNMERAYFMQALKENNKTDEK